MFSWTLMMIVAITIVLGHALLLRSAWRFRKTLTNPPPGIPRSDPRGDIAWTLVTALGTVIFLVFVAQSIL